MNKFFIYSLAKNKKVKIIYFPFLFLIFFSLIIIIGFDFYINNFLIKDIKERFQNREIFVQIDSKKIKNIEESFSKIKNIKAYNYFVDSLNMYVEELGFVSCNSSINNHYPSVSLGRMVDNNKQEIVLPKYINNSNHYHFNTIDYLNKYINFQYNSEENKIVNASYKVVGIYENNIDDKKNNIYISTKTIGNYISGNSSSYIITVDKQKNVRNVENYLEKLSYNYNLLDDSYSNELYVYTSLSKVFNIFKISIIIFLSLLIILIVNDIIKNEIYYLAIMKTVGYSNRIIAINIFIFILYLFLISFTSSFIFYFSVKIIIYIFFKKIVYFCFIKSIIYFLYCLIIVFLSLIVLYYRIKRISIIKLIK